MRDRLLLAGKSEPSIRALRSEDHTCRAEVCRRTGMELVAYDRDEHAISQFERALEIQPAMRGIAHQLAVLYDRQGQFDVAEEYRLRALSRDAKHRQANINPGLVYAACGDFDRSFEVFERATGTAAAHHNGGMLLAREGRTEEAVSHLEASVRRDPGLQQTHAILAQLQPAPADSGIRLVTATSDDLRQEMSEHDAPGAEAL